MTDKDLIVALVEREVEHAVCCEVAFILGDDKLGRDELCKSAVYHQMALHVCRCEKLFPEDFGL